MTTIKKFRLLNVAHMLIQMLRRFITTHMLPMLISNTNLRQWLFHSHPHDKSIGCPMNCGNWFEAFDRERKLLRVWRKFALEKKLSGHGMIHFRFSYTITFISSIFCLLIFFLSIFVFLITLIVIWDDCFKFLFVINRKKSITKV